MLNCTTDKYERLYAPWINKGDDLLDWADMRAGDKVLDLCGGTGSVAMRALARGASEVHLLDLNPRCKDPRVKQFKGRVEAAYTILPAHWPESFKVVGFQELISNSILWAAGRLN